MTLKLLVLALVVAACGGPGATPTPRTELDTSGTWQLTSGRTDAGEVPILDDHPITLTITGDEIGGTAACNRYGGRLAVRDGRLTIDNLAMTAMGCEGPVAASEAAYTGALGMVTTIGREDEELVLSGPAAELRFSQLPPPPTAELVDTTWMLETIFVGDIASAPMGEPATLELRSDGTFGGSTGCRPFDGAWIERGEQIQAHTMAMGDVVCPADLEQQDSHVVSVIGDGFVPTIKGDLLTLIDPGGVGLVYRAQD
jgi:heat shock protein HslJ